MIDDENDVLAEVLARLRHIAGLPDSEAYSELADFIEQVRYGVDGRRYAARAAIEAIRGEVTHLGTSLARGTPLQTAYRGRYLADKLQGLDQSWPEDLRGQLAGDVAELRHSAESVVKDALVAGALMVVREATTQPIPNPQAADRVIRDLREFEAQLKTANALDEHRTAIRSAYERVTRSRWQRKIDEAKVAEAGGSAKKAAKLRFEAAEVLRQDWSRTFPDEPAPEA